SVLSLVLHSFPTRRSSDLAGGKFGQGGYKVSGGLHGVGAAVVNALSSFLAVTTHRDGERFMQRFTNGGQPASDLELIGASKEMRTIIHFKPDPEIFSMTEFKFDTIQERLREAAFLFPDLKITLTDEWTDTTEV